MSWNSFDYQNGSVIVNGVSLGRGEYANELGFALFMGQIEPLKKLKKLTKDDTVKYQCTDGKSYKRIATAFHHQKELDEKEV